MTYKRLHPVGHAWRITPARAEDGRVTPHLMVRGGRKAIDFYTRALSATTTILEYYVDDVDVAYQRAIDAGAKPMLPICDAFYGDRFGWVLDPFGHLWALGTVKEELTPEQVHQRMVASHG